MNSDGFGKYDIEVNRSELSQSGTYTATITFAAASADPPVTPAIVRVTVKIGSSDTVYDAGRHYVLLLRISGENTVQKMGEYAVEAFDGQYSYSFTHVAPGKYRIIAGSDRNNDTYLGDAGEALGAYPTLDQIMDIEVTDTLTDLDFPTDLHLSIGIASSEQNATSPEFSRLE